MASNYFPDDWAHRCLSILRIELPSCVFLLHFLTSSPRSQSFMGWAALCQDLSSQMPSLKSISLFVKYKLGSTLPLSPPGWILENKQCLSVRCAIYLEVFYLLAVRVCGPPHVGVFITRVDTSVDKAKWVCYILEKWKTISYCSLVQLRGHKWVLNVK